MLERLLHSVLNSLLDRLLNHLVKMLLLLSRLLATNPQAALINNDRKLIRARGANANLLIGEDKGGSEENTTRNSGVSNVQGIAVVSSSKRKARNKNVSFVPDGLDEVA